MYKPIEIDRTNLTIMGVRFPDIDTLNRAADAIGSNMFEGFEPTPEKISIICDYISDRITLAQLAQIARNRI
jgi:putative transcriptional regulator